MNVLIYHTLEDSVGGAELVLIHVMNYFLKKPGTTVTILGFQPPNLQQMREFSGIDLPADRVFSVQPSMPAFLKRMSEGLFMIKAAILQRKAKQIAPYYDLCVSTCNEADFGRPAIQYMHHPQLAGYDLLNKYSIIHDKSLLHRVPWLSTPYRMFAALIAGNRTKRIEANLTLTNSHFMKNVITEAYDIKASVVYPSLLDLTYLRPAPETKRSTRLLCLGRIHGDKGTLGLIDLLSAIHRRVPDLELVVAGKVTDFEYYDAVRAKAEALGVPVTFKVEISRAEVKDLLQTSLFFINPKPYEHFGIATVEAATAGCLPIVHKSGGSVEIVPFPELQYANEQDLVEKVARLIDDTLLQQSLLQALAGHIQTFSLTAFYEQLDVAVTAFLKAYPVVDPVPAPAPALEPDLKTT